MNIFRSKKEKYSSLNTKLDKKVSDNNEIYIYTTGLINFDKFDDKNMKYLKWKKYFKNIVSTLPEKYKINVIHYDLKFNHKESDLEDIDLHRSLFSQVINYMNDHGNFVFNYFNPERLSIEIRLVNMIINFFENIEENHVIYDFANIMNSNNFFNIDKFNIVEPMYDLFILNNVNMNEIKLFNFNKEIVIYNEKILEVYDNKSFDFNDIIKIYEIVWKDRVKLFWNKNKEIFRLHKFGKVGEINWKKNLIECFFNIIWDKNIIESEIKNLIVNKFDDILFDNFYKN